MQKRATTTMDKQIRGDKNMKITCKAESDNT